MTPILQCGGYYHHDCERLVPKEWLESKRTMGTEEKEEEDLHPIPRYTTSDACFL